MRFIYVLTIIAALGGMLFGYDTGAISGAILYLKQDFHLSPGAQEVVTSIVLLGATIGAAAGGVLADRYGRRRILILNAAMFVLGSVATALAHSIAWLIAARIFIGSAIGIASFVAPLYLSEAAPPTIRGALVSCNQVALTVGILVSYLVDYTFAFPGGWPWMFGLGAIPALGLGIGILFMPASPRWLAMRGERQAARRTLASIRQKGSDIDSELEDIEHGLAQRSAGLKALLRPSLRMPLMIGIALAVLQQATGINTVIYYAPTIFQYAGFSSAPSSIAATVGIGLVNVAATVIAVWLIDRVGRRPLLLAGESGMALSLTLLGIGFLWHGEATGWIAVGSLIAYVAFFAIGLGPVFWLLISEIYPLEIRGLAMSAATLVNWATNLLVAVTFLSLAHFAGASVTFWIYAALSAIAVIFTWSLVPETKGHTLEEIEAHWRAGRHPLEMGGIAGGSTTSLS